MHFLGGLMDFMVFLESDEKEMLKCSQIHIKIVRERKTAEIVEGEIK